MQKSIQQFNYCSKTSKVVGTQEVDTENHIGILRFLSKSLENICKRVHFWQCCKLYASSFTKKKTLSQAFLKDFAYRFSWQNYRTVILKRHFQSEHFRTESFTGGVSRTLATYIIEFFVTLSVG